MPPFLPQHRFNAGNMRVDFSPLERAVDQFGAQRREDAERRTLADIGKVAATGDYSQAQRAAYEKGRLGLGNQFGQLERQRLNDLKAPVGPAPTSLVRNLRTAYDPNTPPQIRAAILKSINKPTGTNVTVNNAGETAFAKERGKQEAQRFNSVLEEGAQADTTLGKLTQIDEILSNPNLYSGTAGNQVQAVKSALKSVGYDVAGEGEGALFQTLTADLGLQDLKGFKGATSNRELDFVLRKQPGLSRTREGNRLMVSMKRLEQQHVAQKRDLFDQHGGRPPRSEIAKLNSRTNKSFRSLFRQMRKVKVAQPTPAAGFEGVSDGDLLKSLGVQ